MKSTSWRSTAGLCRLMMQRQQRRVIRIASRISRISWNRRLSTSTLCSRKEKKVEKTQMKAARLRRVPARLLHVDATNFGPLDAQDSLLTLTLSWIDNTTELTWGKGEEIAKKAVAKDMIKVKFARDGMAERKATWRDVFKVVRRQPIPHRRETSAPAGHMMSQQSPRCGAPSARTLLGSYTSSTLCGLTSQTSSSPASSLLFAPGLGRRRQG